MALATPTTPLDRQTRAARDRLIDLLLMGETAPLQDLPARVDPPIVAFGGDAKLLVDDSQPDVTYELRDKNGNPRPGPGGQPLDTPQTGDGGTRIFPLPNITAKLDFTILAHKLPGPGPAPLSGRADILLARPSVIPGLATGLAAEVRLSGAPASPPGPLIIDHGAIVEVTITASQEGVDYRLIGPPPGSPANPADTTVLATEPVISAGGWTQGNGGAIRLPSIPLTADTLIRVRCRKQFEGGRTDTQLLTQPLPVLVRADASQAVTVIPDGPVNFAATPTLRLDPAEAGVAYRAYLRPLQEAEFRPGATGPTMRTVPSETGTPPVILALPQTPPTIWPNPPGFTPAGDESALAAGRIDLVLPSLTDDTLVVIQARKTHNPAIAGAAVSSTIGLTAMPVLLVRPDPAPALRFSVAVAKPDAPGSTGPIAVLGGQPGVFYRLRLLPNGPALRLPAYVPRSGKGLAADSAPAAGVWLGIDFVVAGDPPDPPRLLAPDIPFATQISIEAMKARTSALAELPATATLTAPPTIQVLTQPVPPGGVARVTIRASRTSETYALQTAGGATAPVPGTGADLELTAPPLGPDRILTLNIAQSAPAALPFERRVLIPTPAA